MLLWTISIEMSREDKTYAKYIFQNLSETSHTPIRDNPGGTMGRDENHFLQWNKKNSELSHLCLCPGLLKVWGFFGQMTTKTMQILFKNKGKTSTVPVTILCGFLGICFFFCVATPFQTYAYTY